MDWDDFHPWTYPKISLPGWDDDPRPPPKAPDIFDLPAAQRVLLDPKTGKPSGGFTRTGVYLTLVT